MKVQDNKPGSVGHVASYYADSRNDQLDRPMLQQDIDVDVCVVGAGFTGLSVALHLAEKGYRVTLLEAAKIGWGASGRNGGQVVNGLNASLDTIKRRYGEQVAVSVGSMLQEGADIIRTLIKKYQIECDYKPHNIYAAYTAKHMHEFEAKQRLWRQYGMDQHEILSAEEIKTHVGSEAYCGGMLDRSGGHLHPLNLALGEARAFEQLGGVIYESTRVLSIDHQCVRPQVFTENGVVNCGILVLCGNAYLGATVPELSHRVMPVSTQMIATEPLGCMADDLLPTDACVEDARYILDYFRLSADRRLLFGGGVVYGGTEPADVVAKLKPNLERVFPCLKNVRYDYAWSGNFALSFSRVPQLGRLSAQTYYAHGYSGHGVTGSHLFGKILSEAIDGDVSRFDTFARLPWIPFPGGQRFRAPYSTVGSWWYSLRDALGV